MNNIKTEHEVTKRHARVPYLDEFLSLKCSPDILAVVNPINYISKEISESMAVIKVLRGIALTKPMHYYLADICAGNALTAVTAAHLLPFKWVTAIDIRERGRDWHKVKRFNYKNVDINDMVGSDFEQYVISSIHPCRDLAKKIINLYNNSPARHLVMMPCCVGNIPGNMQYFQKQLGKYMAWCIYLSQLINAPTTIKRDENIHSPCNCILIADKEAN